jgi:RNA polymerase sigma factor (sigma-70 family)
MNLDTAKLGEQEEIFALLSQGDDPAVVRSARLEFAQERLLKLTRKMLGGFPKLRRWEQTDDVFQRAMLRLNRALSEVEVESLSHFLNLAAIQIRRELLDLTRFYFGQHGLGANHHTDGLPRQEVGGAIHRTGDESLASGPEDLEDWELFHSAVEELPVEQREVFSLVFYQGLKQQVAAELMHMPLRTFKRRLQQAKIGLQSRLNRENKRRATG